MELDDGGGADLRILVDAAGVEVFTGDGHALTARVYPDSQASTDLVAGANPAEGHATVRWWKFLSHGRVTAPTP